MIFGNNVIVDLFYEEGQLSKEFSNDNYLIRKTDENCNNVGGYLDPNKRNITDLKLCGESLKLML